MEKENYSPKEIAGFVKIGLELYLEEYKLEMYGGNNEIKKMIADDLFKKIEEYKTKVPENVRKEIWLDTNKLEEISSEYDKLH